MCILKNGITSRLIPESRYTKFLCQINIWRNSHLSTEELLGLGNFNKIKFYEDH